MSINTLKPNSHQCTDPVRWNSSSSINKHIATPHSQPLHSSDLFAPKHCHICPWDQSTDWIATWPLPLRPDFWHGYESEHAEHMRAWDQLDLLLLQRGLKELNNGPSDEEGGET